MSETFNTKALVLNRHIYCEYDSRVTVYTVDFGKIDLLARGTQKPGSKLAAHIEPLSLVNLMIVKGKNTDYIGSSVISDAYAGIKGDLTKLPAAGSALFAFNRLVRHEEKDEELFNLLLEFLDILDQKPRQADWLLASWSLKFLSALGYQPELYRCVFCQKRLVPEKLYFNAKEGGIICHNCFKKVKLVEEDKSSSSPFAAARVGKEVSIGTIKILRIILAKNWATLSKLKIEKSYLKSLNIISKT